MSLKPLTSWVEEQYDHIEHYFWSPQEIGRKTHGPKRTFAEWRDKLASHSTSMKHFLTQYFVLCPQSVTDQVLSKLCDKTCVGLSLVNPYHGVNLEGIEFDLGGAYPKLIEGIFQLFRLLVEPLDQVSVRGWLLAHWLAFG